MTNGHDIPGDFILGKCPYCKELVKNRHRIFEDKLKEYVHFWCTPDNNGPKKDRDEVISPYSKKRINSKERVVRRFLVQQCPDCDYLDIANHKGGSAHLVNLSNISWICTRCTYEW